MGKTANIAFWGPDVAEMATLVQTLKTGIYAQQSASVYPLIESVKIEDVTLTATIPSGNEGERRSFQSSLADYDGIVYVADTLDSESTATSKVELESLLGNETISRPILVLFSASDPSNERQIVHDLGLAEKENNQVGIFAYSLSLAQNKGYKEDTYSFSSVNLDKKKQVWYLVEFSYTPVHGLTTHSFHAGTEDWKAFVNGNYAGHSPHVDIVEGPVSVGHGPRMTAAIVDGQNLYQAAFASHQALTSLVVTKVSSRRPPSKSTRWCPSCNIM